MTCWRSECRTGCYYPDVCTEKPAPTPCPVCGGGGIVDTSPPGVDRHPWLQTDTDCPRCGGEGVVEETDTTETTDNPDEEPT